MALTLTAAFLREARKATSSPTILVQIADYTGARYAWASRKVLGFPCNVLGIDSRTSEIDPLECRQSLSTTTVEFIDDGLVRTIIENNAIVGKTMTFLIGFDTGDDGTFLESDYAGFAGGIIDGYSFESGKVKISVKDPRSLVWEREGTGNGKAVSRKVPEESAGDAAPDPIAIVGSAHVAIKTLLDEAGVPASLYTASTFLPANHTDNGHLVVYRDKYGASSDRRLKEPTPVAELVDEIAKMIRAYVLVHEDGKVILKSFNGSAAAVDRFTELDMVAGSVRGGIEFGNVVTSVYVRSMWQGYNGNDNAGGYRFRYRDDDAAAQVEWGHEDGDARKADWQHDDRWFGGSCGNWQNQVIAVGAATLHLTSKNFCGNTAASGTPLTANADRPGYLWILGAGGKNASGGDDHGEVVRFESVASHTVNGFVHYDVTTLTHAEFGTTDGGHAVSSGNGSGQLLWDITAPVYAGDQVLQRFAEGAAVLEFETGLHKYAVQLGDLVYAETPIFIRKGLNGLAVGNTTKFEVVKKDVDLEKGTIEWKLVEVRAKSRSPLVSAAPYTDLPNIVGDSRDWDVSGSNVQSVNGLFNDSTSSFVRAWVNGGVPVASPASLSITVPEQLLSTAGHGLTSAPKKAFTFTALRDVYLDFNPQDGEAGHWEYQEVANGAAAPAVSTKFVRAYKFVTDGSGITDVTDLRSTQLVDGPNLKTGDVGGTGALVNVDATGRLVDPVIKDSAGSPVEDLVYKNVEGVFRAYTTGGTERAVKHKKLIAGESSAITPPNSDGVPYSWVFDRDTTNFINNPSFRANVTDGWTVVAGTFSRITTQNYWGPAAGKMLASDDCDVRSNSTPAAQNETWCASVFFKGAASVIGQIKLEFLDGATVVQTVSDSFVYLTGVGWSRAFVSGTATDANTDAVRIRIDFFIPLNDLYISGAQLEQGSYPTSYCDGSLGPGYEWSGTEDNSSSSRLGGFHVIGALDGADGRPLWALDDGTLQLQKGLEVGEPYKRVRITATDAGDCLIDVAAADSDTGGIDLKISGFGDSGGVSIVPGSSGYFKVGDSGACFSAVPAAVTSLTAGAYTHVTFGTEEFDLGSNFAASVFTAPEAGIYEFWALQRMGAFTAGKEFVIRLEKNTGGGYASWREGIDFVASAANIWSGGVHAMGLLAAGDLVRVTMFNGDSVARNTAGAGYFQGKRIA